MVTYLGFSVKTTVLVIYECRTMFIYYFIWSVFQLWVCNTFRQVQNTNIRLGIIFQQVFELYMFAFDESRHVWYLNTYTVKKPQSLQALPRSWMTLDRWSGLEEVSKEKSITGIESSGSISETASWSCWFWVKLYVEGMEVRPGDSASALTQAIFAAVDR